MALQIDGHALVVAFAEPPEPAEIDELAGRIGHRIHPVLADPVRHRPARRRRRSGGRPRHEATGRSRATAPTWWTSS